MQIVRDTDSFDLHPSGGAVAIGNFDGVHLGHQVVLRRAAEIARARNLPFGVMTFEPHPRQFFAPDVPAFRLMNAKAKANKLKRFGVDRLYQINFNAALASLSPDDFVRDIIINKAGIHHVIIGQDFHFGKNRTGTPDTLRQLGQDLGFGVDIVPLLHQTEEVSSTNIRLALSQGRPRDAAKMMGEAHSIEGVVIGGEQRGRELGFPTANMTLDGLHQPRFGVYAVRVRISGGPHQGDYIGAASVGVRPVFGQNNMPNIETYIFDFKGDIYGETLYVSLVDFLRPELKFNSVEDLIAQMHADCAQARDILRHDGL